MALRRVQWLFEKALVHRSVGQGLFLRAVIIVYTRLKTQQAVAVINSEKKNSKTPVSTAPVILVAAKGIASRTMDSKTVPRIPLRIAPEDLPQLFAVNKAPMSRMPR